MKVFLADQLVKVRSALRLLIEQEFHGEVVGEASCAADLFRHLRSSHPDLLILDWNLPDWEGKHSIAEIRDLRPDLKVVAVQCQGSASEVGEMAGADAVISKGDSPGRVLAVLRSFQKMGGNCPRSDRKENQFKGVLK